MDEYAVIVAGGSGTRMKAKLPKQFIEVGSLPILMHTINCFIAYSNSIKIILVLPENQVVPWEKLCVKYKIKYPNLQVVHGGNTRFQSCKNGINAILSKNAVVAIHDGVRPFLTHEILETGFVLAKNKGAAVCAVESKDSARYLNESLTENKALERSRLRLIQTPQIFSLKILKKAYQVNELAIFTDDASVVEYAGFAIYLFEGSYQNIKITTKEDLALATILQKNITVKKV